MGTKDNPGQFDCYHAAKPDEPMFVLLARDRLAGFLVSIWSSLRYGDEEAARAKFERMISDHLQHYLAEPDLEKAHEALTCALAMFEWRKLNRQPPKPSQPIKYCSKKVDGDECVQPEGHKDKCNPIPF